jgi:hypothetical protein
MPTIIVSAYNVAAHPQVGGHFWAYMQYVQGLRQLGCEVYWLERFEGSGDTGADEQMLSIFYRRMEGFGLSGKTLLYSVGSSGLCEYRGISAWQAQQIMARTDLLLNFYYHIPPNLLAAFAKTALVDIDPGLLQHWISQKQLSVAPHHHYFSTGETAGTPGARFPDCGLNWVRIRPLVCLEWWPYRYDPACSCFSTVSGWWAEEWVTDLKTFCFENTKRASFLQFADLPKRTHQPLQLALSMGEGVGQKNLPSNAAALCQTDYWGDGQDRERLIKHGWQICLAQEVAGSPQDYQNYIGQSRGEFSCAKPSCMYFQNAWVSDRTLCYLASGKPVVVQHTGPSAYLPSGEGMFRFSSHEEAIQAFATINANYKQHCHSAREIAEAFFDAKPILTRVLNTAL